MRSGLGEAEAASAASVESPLSLPANNLQVVAILKNRGCCLFSQINFPKPASRLCRRKGFNIYLGSIRSVSQSLKLPSGVLKIAV